MEGHDDPRPCARAEWELLPTRAGVQLSLRLVRSKTHKLTRDLISGAGELYDLVNDPHEMKNVFDDARYAGVRAELTEMIHARPDDAIDLQTQVGLA
jgi:hypothetical protein